MIFSPANPQETAVSLPMWMQITAFAVSVGLAALRSFEFLRRPRLYLHVTRDLYFRLIDPGEALFCSAVLLATNGSVLVRGVTPELRRIDKGGGTKRAQKQFPLSVSQHGEKVPGPSVNVDHKFFGSSALQYLEASKPHRAIYLCFQREYQDRQKRAVSSFTNSLEAFRDENGEATEEDAPKLRERFTDLIDAQFSAMVPLIQIESGDYELELHVEYECVGWRFFNVRQKVRSTIQFSVDEISLQNWKSDLKKLLVARGQQIVTKKYADVVYPQLEPIDLIEAIDK